MSHYHHEDHVEGAANGASNLSRVSPADSQYWLSLEQWAQDPKFLEAAEHEFTSSPLREGEKESGWARREFLKLMGASLAMATAGCIRRPVQKIVPYNKQPEEVTLGMSSYYSSTFFDGQEAIGLLIRSRDGRPIKVEGNPRHPFNKGATSARAQAHILSLYDPERLQGPKKNLLNKTKTNRDTIGTKWDEADAAIVEQLKKGGVAVLTGSMASISTRALIGDFCQAFGAQHVVWDPVGESDLREGQRLSYGDSLVPFYRFDKADVIVSIDADFLGTWIAPSAFTKQFSSRRKNIDTMNKLVSFDSLYSLTGANADVRVRIKPSQQLWVAMGLAHDIIVGKGFGRYAGDSKVKEALSGFAKAWEYLGVDKQLWDRVVSDLVKNAGKSLVVAGGLATKTEQSVALQVAVNLLNSALDNEGTTVLAGASMPGQGSDDSALLKLVDDLNKGTVKTVIIHRVNPMYSSSASVGFKEAIKKANLVVYTGDRIDETALQADYLLPDNHAMESWGDVEFTKGLISIQQPTIRPLYDTRSFQLSLMNWAYLAEQGPARLRDYESYYDYLRAFWRSEVHPKYGSGQSFDAFWDAALQDGFIGSEAQTSAARSFRSDSLAGVKAAKSSSEFELVLYPTVMLNDGTYANISWLQEVPDPVTKICWDNYVSLSLTTAEKLNVKEGHLINLKVGDKVMTLPAHVQPGLHDGVAAVAVGYGRTHAGKVANKVGVNVYDFINVKGGKLVASGQEVVLENTRKAYPLANPQGHHSMEGRKIVVEATLQEYLKDKAANNHKHKIWTIWDPQKYNGHKWGMAVDLNTCTGCNACVVACQSENNIPVVGKKYVIQGREMHWMRIDRYYVGDPKNAEVVFQPVMCQHCDNAPCETVCPVIATAHSSEGTNDMAYNRCVGTRYCANNCPYKVRRFNWFNFTGNIEKPMHLALNPDVTVRVRGVMEKCTFCIHRIKEGKNKVKLEGRAFKDGDVKTACQTACPADAIAFGDLNDKESVVAKAFNEDPRNYALLEEFHAAPSVRYLTKIRNNDEANRGGHHGGGH